MRKGTVEANTITTGIRQSDGDGSTPSLTAAVEVCQRCLSSAFQYPRGLDHADSFRTYEVDEQLPEPNETVIMRHRRDPYCWLMEPWAKSLDEES